MTNDTEKILDAVNEALGHGNPQEALDLLDQLSFGDCCEVNFLKGEVYYKMERWGEALNQFMLFHEQFPTDKRAASYCTMVQNILGFYHKDLYNP